MVFYMIVYCWIYILLGIDCEHPGNVTNGMVSFDGTYLDDIATYTCNFGYELVGSSQRVCQLNETWSNMVPTCDRKFLVFALYFFICNVIYF